MHALLWLMDGLVAGWLTGKMIAGEGRHLVMDVVMGMAGGIAAGFIAGRLGTLVQGKMIFTDLAAMLGAVALTVLSRWLGGRRKYGTTG
jgi:uncharacterized membrane protein YeaQ/YmgE (transglycosylase-associated protein family)